MKFELEVSGDVMLTSGEVQTAVTRWLAGKDKEIATYGPALCGVDIVVRRLEG